MSVWDLLELPEFSGSGDLVSVSVDSTHVNSIVASLVRTVHSQAQCIENLENETKARALTMERWMTESDERHKLELAALTDELRALHQDVVRRSDMSRVRDQMSPERGAGLDTLAQCARMVKEEVGCAATMLRAESAQREEAHARLHQDFQAIMGEQHVLRELVRKLDADVMRLGLQLGGLMQLAEGKSQAEANHARDLDNLLQIFSLTRTSLAQAALHPEQLDLNAAPLFHRVLGDLGEACQAIDRRLEDVVANLLTHSHYINQKADVEVLQHTQDVLIQNITKGDRELAVNVEELKLNVWDCLASLTNRIEVLEGSTRGVSAASERAHGSYGDLEVLAARISRLERDTSLTVQQQRQRINAQQLSEPLGNNMWSSTRAAVTFRRSSLSPQRQ
eukprot:NODE_1520_length_1503_cov_68.803301_g1373_i0.p1 GENE.NODE_1520_length_1503_cov_68.803301_g1373_i0~~NODE_1520_length_1503_cov_68.803301_g1373_i0.p1  ORF type:complete len:394 (-),score=94.67 NODE_1520_length_1503_cov_68.803301_g1373_i0:130-1311(-)